MKTGTVSAVRVVCLALVVACAPSEARAQWVTTNGPAARTQAFTLIPTPDGTATRLFAGTEGGGVFVASGGYTKWTAANNGLTNGNVLSLVTSINPTGGVNPSAGTHGGGTFFSFDGGGRWFASGGPAHKVVRALIDVIDEASYGDNFVLAGTDGGVFRSNNNGLSWFPFGLPNVSVRAFTATPDSSDVNVFAGTSGGGVFLYTNLSGWRAANQGLTNRYVAALTAGSPTGTFTRPVFAGTVGGGVFRSTDGGRTWIAVNNRLTNRVVQALVAVGGNVFAGTLGGGVFLSADNGASWRAVNSGLPDPAVFALATDGTNLFAATGAGVYRRPLAQLIAN